jgi:putative PIN family toxin of toxin-antitoxin system
MTIVFDSNVCISAFITTSGVTKDVFLYCGERHRVVISEYIIREVSEKLHCKLGFTLQEAGEVSLFLRQHMEVVELPKAIAISVRDSKDAPIIALALSVKADFLITGDKDLLSLKKTNKTEIIQPSEFWKKSRVKGSGT